MTQPPLDWPAFEAWMADATRRGLHEAARLVIGFPCISSAANCGFWLALCNAGSNAEVQGSRAVVPIWGSCVPYVRLELQSSRTQAVVICSHFVLKKHEAAVELSGGGSMIAVITC